MSNVGLVEVTKSAHNLSNGNSCLSFTHRVSRSEELKQIHTRDTAGGKRRVTNLFLNRSTPEINDTKKLFERMTCTYVEA